MAQFTHCCVTHQTIAAGDQVRVLPVFQQAAGCTATVQLGNGAKVEVHPLNAHAEQFDRFWSQIGSFIEATYTGSGFQLAATRPQAETLLHFFAELHCNAARVPEQFDFQAFVAENAPLVHSFVTYSWLRDEPKEADTVDKGQLWRELNACWDYFWSGLQGLGSVFGMNQAGVWCPVGVAVMHAEAYRTLVEYEGGIENLRPMVKQWHAAEQGDGSDMAQYLRAGSFSFPLMNTQQLEVIKRRVKSGSLTNEMLFMELRACLQAKRALQAMNSLSLKLIPAVFHGASKHSATMVDAAYLQLVSCVQASVAMARRR